MVNKYWSSELCLKFGRANSQKMNMEVSTKSITTSNNAPLDLVQKRKILSTYQCSLDLLDKALIDIDFNFSDLNLTYETNTDSVITKTEPTVANGGKKSCRTSITIDSLITRPQYDRKSLCSLSDLFSSSIFHSSLLPVGDLGKGGTVKAVRFAKSDDKLCTRHSYDSCLDMTTQEIEDAWWSRTQATLLQRNAHQIALFAVRDSRKFVQKSLNDSYDAAIQIGNESSPSSIHEMLQNPARLSAATIVWCQLANARRGLERYIMKSDNYDQRTNRATQHRLAVLQQYQSILEDISSPALKSDIVKAVAEVSCSHSKPDIIYARMIGHGDAVAADKI
jgi:hypothetical protein